MTATSSVLAHMAPWLYQPLEDRGTDALAYILNRSASCRAALDGLIYDSDLQIDSISRVETQVIDDPESRPDMIGYTVDKKRRLMVEVKFWAILQPRQAWRYYQKLENSDPGVLLFICPESAIRYYWPEVCAQLEEDEEEPVKLDRCEDLGRMRRAHVVGRNRRVIMIGWELLLDRLAAVALDFQTRSDIHQLQGLVQLQNEAAFPPLTDRTVTGFVERDEHLRKLVGDAVENGREAGFLSVKNLRWTSPTRTDCYGRYFSVIGAAAPWARLSIEYREDRYRRSPLWIMTRTEDWQGLSRPSNLVDGKSGDYSWIPVSLKGNAVYEQELAHVVDQLRDLSDALLFRHG